LGVSRLGLLIEVMRSVEERVFQDGGSMICVRRPETEEYIALDEHGTLFIYSSDSGYLSLCEQLGFENRENELLDAAPHWHVRPAHYKTQSRPFIKTLGLKHVR